MNVKRSQRKKRRPVPVPVASMGNIAFLLIIFFMVCSDISKEPEMDLTSPRSSYVETIEVTVAARVAVDVAGQIFLDGLRVNSAKDVESRIRELLANTVADEQRHVQFKCDAALPKEMFEPVLQAIAEGGGIIEAVGDLEE